MAEQRIEQRETDTSEDEAEASKRAGKTALALVESEASDTDEKLEYNPGFVSQFGGDPERDIHPGIILFED
jgi:hypothetical protein